MAGMWGNKANLANNKPMYLVHDATAGDGTLEYTGANNWAFANTFGVTDPAEAATYANSQIASPAHAGWNLLRMGTGPATNVTISNTGTGANNYDANTIITFANPQFAMNNPTYNLYATATGTVTTNATHFVNSTALLTNGFGYTGGEGTQGGIPLGNNWVFGVVTDASNSAATGANVYAIVNSSGIANSFVIANAGIANNYDANAIITFPTPAFGANVITGFLGVNSTHFIANVTINASSSNGGGYLGYQYGNAHVYLYCYDPATPLGNGTYTNLANVPALGVVLLGVINNVQVGNIGSIIVANSGPGGLSGNTVAYFPMPSYGNTIAVVGSLTINATGFITAATVNASSVGAGYIGNEPMIRDAIGNTVIGARITDSSNGSANGAAVTVMVGGRSGRKSWETLVAMTSMTNANGRPGIPLPL